MSANLLSSVLAEAAAAEPTTVPAPLVMGGIAFGVLAVLLFLVTRLDRDR